MSVQYIAPQCPAILRESLGQTRKEARLRMIGNPRATRTASSFIMINSLVVLALSPLVFALEPFYSALHRCPLACDISGLNTPGNWTHYPNARRLRVCEETTLFEINIHGNGSNVADGHIGVRACTAPPLQLHPAASPRHGDCRSRLKVATMSRGVDVVLQHPKRLGNVTTATSSDMSDTAAQLVTYLKMETSCDSTTMFARSGEAVAGLFVGAEVVKSSAARVLNKFIKSADFAANSSSWAQVCDNDTASTEVLGMFVSGAGDLGPVKAALANWSKAKCLPTSPDHRVELWRNSSISFIPAIDLSRIPELGIRQAQVDKRLSARATCQYIQVAARDGCDKLARRCGITPAQFTQFNPQPDLCSNLITGQYVCCSAGELPDFTPKPNQDGTCFSFAVKSDDTCDDIAARHSISTEDIESFNGQTWGWAGCSALQLGQVICLSTGRPPMPSPVTNAICGPQMPGTAPPTDPTISLADLNPCPLNACCDTWGQCGTTSEFCTPTPADTGAPGTAQPGTWGCISNCGTDIVNHDVGPAAFSRVAYFEAWNLERDCLHMDVTNIPPFYTHIHFAFATIADDYTISVEGVEDQFAKMLGMTTSRRIISFGGWSFSTDYDTFGIFRKGVTDQQRQLFADNVVKFVVDNNLDGVDFDWEYPAAPDIPGIPAGDPGDGLRYLDFLKVVKAALPPEKTVSIAAPASYWYLKGFPIAEMAAVIDYIIYMTYDLHGQWDYGSPWASPSCDKGNCLRSHVNMTETKTALSMITKAGVPSNKVMVGVSSYGRGFKMTTPECTGPECTYEGPRSGAELGVCTKEAGYIGDAELRAIIANSADSDVPAMTYHDDLSDSDIVVWNDVQWAAYMDTPTKSARTAWYGEMNFAGTTDWAVDLQADYTYDPTGDDGSGSGAPSCDPNITYDTLDALQEVAGSFPVYCRDMMLITTLQKELDRALIQFTDVNANYVGKFNAYVRYIKSIIPLTITKAMTEGADAFFDCRFVDGDNEELYNGPCPTPQDISLPVMFFSEFYALRDPEGFFAALENTYGVDRSWIKFGEVHDIYTTCPTSNPVCVPYSHNFFGFPMEADDVQVADPQAVVNAAMPGIETLRATLDNAAFALANGFWMGPAEDLSQTLEIPVVMILQAVDSMAQIKEIGDEQQEQEKKELILKVLGWVFMVAPFVGELGAAAIGWATVARVISLMGVLGNAALEVEGIVSDPSSAPMALMGMMLGFIDVPKGVGGVSKMAEIRRSITGDVLGKMGDVAKRSDDMVQGIIKACARK